jgi:hypothetical protein
MMSTDIQAEEQLEMGTQLQAAVTETNLLAQGGFRAEEIVALLWLRNSTIELSMQAITF